MDHEKDAPVLRIGELSRRVGLSEHVLRAWESRYGLLRPVRSAGGYRLYSRDDQARVARMQAYLGDGLAAAQAAAAAIAAEAPGALATGGGDVVRQADLAESAGALRRVLDDLDEPGAQAQLDGLLTDFTVETVLRDVVTPYLHELGERWDQGVISVAQEHFATHVIRGRLVGLARGWGTGQGPQVLLACPPDELHDMSLLVFGIVLHRAGWRVEYLGANTPMPDTIQVTGHTRPSLVVLAASSPQRFAAVVRELTGLAQLAPLALAGEGASRELASSVGARLLEGDPVSAAEHVASS